MDTTDFQTSDLYLASTLLSEGFKLKSTRADPRGHRKVFVFDDSSALREVAARFFGNSLSVNLRSYLNAWRELRRQCDY